ncbi:MAG: DUF5130 family protein [Marmoricola sp.]
MPTGEGFSPEQRRDVDRAIRAAEMACRFEFSVFFGHAEDDKRDYAERLHAVMASPDRSVLVMVDPGAHALEVVTGKVVRRDLDDDAVRLAVLTMRSAFADGDLVGGITRGLAMMAEAAHRPETLHTTE